MKVVDIADSVRVAKIGRSINWGEGQVSVKHVRGTTLLLSKPLRTQAREDTLRAFPQRVYLCLGVEIAQDDVPFAAKVLNVLRTERSATRRPRTVWIVTSRRRRGPTL
jgi:hypothetical protein